VALLVESAPSGTAGQLGVLPRREWGAAGPPNLVNRSITTVRAGMLIPSDRVSVAKTAFKSPAEKQASTASRNAGTMPAWCAATPLEALEPLVVPEHGEVLVGQLGDVASAMARMVPRWTG